MKSIFTKLSTLLLCGAVALVGCTDYSEDIQLVDKNLNDLKTEFDGHKTSTAATIAELQSAIDALEAAQEQMAAEYDAKTSELETAVTTLQNLVNENAKTLQAQLTEAAGKIAALETGKADKAVVDQLQKDVTKAIEDANVAIAALDAAKADKAELDLVKADVATLIEGYLQTVNLLQNISNTLTTIQSDLDIVEEDVATLKDAAAQAVLEIAEINASIDALTKRVSALETAVEEAEKTIAAHAELLAGLRTDLEAVEGDLEAETTARENADKALDDAIVLLNRQFNNLEIDFKTYVEEMEAYKANLEAQIDELYKHDSELAGSILSYYEQSIAAVDSAVKDLRDEIAALEDKIIAAWQEEKVAIHNMIYNIQGELQAWCQENSDAIEDLQAMDSALALSILDYYNQLVEAMTAGDADLQTQLDDHVAAIYKTIMSEVDQLEIIIEESDAALLEKVETNLKEIRTIIENNYNDLAAQIKELRNELENAIKGVEANVEKLLARVQSLVYVPDFDDHKAAIYFAELNKTKTYISRQSIMRYRVNAKAGESAEKAAAELAEAWKADPTILSFELEQVATRSEEAALKIAKVEAKGEDLFVYAVAKNFASDFFAKDKKMYSAALVLSDGNNNISSSYTNLRAGNKDNVTAVVINAEGKEITDKTAPAELLPYDGQDPAEVVVLKGHRLGFKINYDMNAYLTIDEMIAAGYDINVIRRVEAIQAGHGSNDHAADKDGVVRNVGNFNIEERPFISNNVESDTYVWLNGEVKKEEYKALKEKNENILTLDFNYIVNGIKVTTSAAVEMCNRLVQVDLGAVEIPWTLKLADDLYTAAGAYTAPVSYEGFAYDIAKSANKPLQGYSLYSILQTGSPVKTLGGNYDIQMSINDKTLDFTLTGDYAFAPVNDEDGWNVYTVQWVNNFDDLTITVKAAIKLGKLPEPFVMDDKALDFKVVEGTNNQWVYAQSEIVENMFAKYRDIIGLAKDDEAKALFTKVLARTAVDAKNTNVNGYDLLEWNITTPIASFDPLTIGLYEEQFSKDGVEKINVAQKDANTGVEFKFNFEGKVNLPKDLLAYSTVDYVNFDAEQNRWEVEVDGDVVNNKYTIDQADLGKYFYVVKDADYLINRGLEVKFEVITKNAPKPLDTDVVSVYNDPVSGINVLETEKSIIKDWTDGGKFGENEIVVKATLYAHGFAVDSKEVTLFTVDPLKFSKIKDIEVERVPGKDAVAYTHSVLSLTSVAEEGNLIKTDSYPSQIFADSHADVIYGAKFIPSEKYPDYNCRLVSVWTGDREAGTAELYPSNKYLFNNGKITLTADDGLLNQPIYAEVEYVLTHDFNIGEPEVVTVKVTFTPNNTL